MDPSNTDARDPVLLTQQAFDALDEGNLEVAQDLASQLEELSYSSHFEIQALIHIQNHELEAAVRVLRQGVKYASRVWLLWQLLANTLSNLGEMDEAMECYDTALQLDLEADDIASLQFNRATLLSRLSRTEEALDLVESYSQTPQISPGLSWRFASLRIGLLADLERCDEVLERAAQLREILEDVEEYEEALVDAWTQGGFALLDCEQNDLAREWAEQALAIDRTSHDALKLLRVSDFSAPQADRYYQVILEGEWSDPEAEDEEELGFFTTYTVIARTPDEAKSLALQMESPRWEKPLTIEECEFLGECEEIPVGVWDVDTYNLFPLSDEDEDD